MGLLSALLEHYEVLLAMRDLKIQADLARPPAPTLQQNLEHLFGQGHCPDFTLVYQGTRWVLMVLAKWLPDFNIKIVFQVCHSQVYSAGEMSLL